MENFITLVQHLTVSGKMIMSKDTNSKRSIHQPVIIHVGNTSNAIMKLEERTWLLLRLSLFILNAKSCLSPQFGPVPGVNQSYYAITKYCCG